jgi:hypothetical protein
MAVSRKDDLTPERRALFEAADKAARAAKTGKLVIDVIAGKAVEFHFEEEEQYPRS